MTLYPYVIATSLLCSVYQFHSLFAEWLPVLLIPPMTYYGYFSPNWTNFLLQENTFLCIIPLFLIFPNLNYLQIFDYASTLFWSCYNSVISLEIVSPWDKYLPLFQQLDVDSHRYRLIRRGFACAEIVNISSTYNTYNVPKEI